MAAYTSHVTGPASFTQPSPPPPEPVQGTTLRDIYERYRDEHCMFHFADTNRKQGITRRGQSTLAGLRGWLKLHGGKLADEYRPVDARASMADMATEGLKRLTINERLAQLKAMLDWAATMEYIEPRVAQMIRATRGLKRGQHNVRDNRRVQPVDWENVEPIKPFVSAQVWALVQLQWLMAARSSELLKLKRGDICMDDEVWTVTLADHKTAIHGIQRVLFFGPKCQAILAPFMDRDDDYYLFSPKEAERSRYASCPVHRHQPVLPPRTKHAD